MNYKKIITLLSILLVLTLSVSIYYIHDENKLKSENVILKEKLDKYQSDLVSKELELEGIKKSQMQRRLSITYVSYDYKRRFISDKTFILSLPSSESPIMNEILPNTIVEVIHAALVDGVKWLYVLMPVYSGPDNMYGWIKESDTKQYTKEVQKFVQSDVKVMPKSPVFRTNSYDSINSTNPDTLTNNDIRGRIEKRKDGYVELQCTGGETFWLKEEYLIYPIVE